MYNCNSSYNCYTRHNMCCCNVCCCIEPAEPANFLSSYIEAVGSTQDVASNGDFVFDTSQDILDVVGKDITLDSTGTTFTINRTGLYRVEWSMNMSTGTAPVLVGLLENGEPSSALSNNALVGNHSSGALINVEAGDLPYTITLHNFGGAVSVANPAIAQNTAVSLRISRIADGPSS